MKTSSNFVVCLCLGFMLFKEGFRWHGLTVMRCPGAFGGDAEHGNSNWMNTDTWKQSRHTSWIVVRLWDAADIHMDQTQKQPGWVWPAKMKISIHFLILLRERKIPGTLWVLTCSLFTCEWVITERVSYLKDNIVRLMSDFLPEYIFIKYVTIYTNV